MMERRVETVAEVLYQRYVLVENATIQSTVFPLVHFFDWRFLLAALLIETTHQFLNMATNFDKRQMKHLQHDRNMVI